MGAKRPGRRSLIGAVVLLSGLIGGLVLGSPTTSLASEVLASSASGPSAHEVRATLELHPDVQAALAEVEVAKGELGLVRNGYLPSLNASAGPAGSDVGYEVTLSQTVHDWGTTRSRIDEKQARLDLRLAHLGVVQDDAALEFIEVYLDVASHRAVLILMQDHLAALSALDEMAQARLSGRYGDLGETGRMALALAQVRAQSTELQGRLDEAQSHFEHLTGRPPSRVRLPAMPYYLSLASDEANLTDLIAASPLYRRASLEVKAANATVRGTEGARYPRLVLEGSLLRREIGGRLVNDSSLNLRLRSASLQGLAFWQEPQLARHRRDAAARTADGIRRDLERMVASLRLTDQALAARITALSDQVSGAQDIRDIYHQQFLVGRREIQDLVAIESEYFSAERQIIELTVERLRVQYRIAAQLGLLATSFTEGEVSQGAAP